MYRSLLGALVVLMFVPPALAQAQVVRDRPLKLSEVMAAAAARDQAAAANGGQQQVVQRATYRPVVAIEASPPTQPPTTSSAPAGAVTKRGAVEAARIARTSNAPAVSRCPYNANTVHGSAPCVCGYEGSTYLAVVNSDPNLAQISPVELNNRIYGSQAQPGYANQEVSNSGNVPYDTGHYYANGQWVADTPVLAGNGQMIPGAGGFVVGRNPAPLGTSVWGPRGGHPFGGGSAGDYQRIANMRANAVMRGFGSAGDWNRQATNQLNSLIRRSIPNGSLRGFNTWRAVPGLRGFSIPRLW